MISSIRLAFLALAVAIPSHATAQSRDQFNNIVPPSTSYDDPTLVRLYPNNGKAKLKQLQKMCSSNKPADLQTCNEAWREINTAYAKLKGTAPAVAQ